MGAISYVGVPLFSSKLEVNGVFAVLHDQPLSGKLAQNLEIILNAFSDWCGHKIEAHKLKIDFDGNISKPLLRRTQFQSLTKRELEVVALLIKGFSDKGRRLMDLERIGQINQKPNLA